MDQIATEIEESTRRAADAGTDPSARVRSSIRALVELLVADPARAEWRSSQRARGRGGGPLFVGRRAEPIAAWLDGTTEASPEQIGEAGSRSFLGL